MGRRRCAGLIAALVLGATLVVLDKNPLDDIRHTNSIRYVMKNGELFEGDTLTQIWPSRKELRKFWWWQGNPKIPTAR